MSNRDDLWSRWRASPAHTLLYSWTGQAHYGVALFSPSPRTGQDWLCLLPQSMERESAATAENAFFFFYRHKEQTGHQSSAVHPMSCVTWRRTLLILEEHSCSGHTHLHVLVISITKPFTLKDKISFAYSIGADNCLSSNWALGSTITLRKQWEAYQQGNSFPLLWPEKQ